MTAVDNGIVLVLIILVVLPIAAVLFARSGATWRGIGSSGPFAIDPDLSQRRRVLDSAPQRPTLSEELRAEVRELVVASNERRMSRGQEPLDVEAETERQCADFIGLGK